MIGGEAINVSRIVICHAYRTGGVAARSSSRAIMSCCTSLAPS
jgi:hypothetical protein